MTIIKRFSLALAFGLSSLFFSAQAQTPSVSTVNVAPDEQKVRVSAVGDVLDMSVSVSDEAGDVVFESGPVTGDHLDWTMSDPQGQKLPAGTYTLAVTYRMPSGKLKRRVEQVSVTDEVTTGATATKESQAAAAVATITGQGTTNKVAKFTGANSIGDSAITEVGGKVGVGTLSPQQSIHAVGASSRLRLQSTNGTALTTTEYVTNGRVWQSGAGGSTAANGVANKFFVFDQTAGQFRLVIDSAGNFGVGTTTPTSKLTVNGGIQILGSGNGIKFADGSIQTKATAGTITGTGTTNRLAKFTGPNSFGNSSITETSGKVGIGTAAPATALDVRGHLTLDAGSSPILYTSSLSGEQNRFLQLINSPSSPSASGLKAGGILVSDSYAYADPGKNDLIVKGSVGIGTHALVSRLTVSGGGATAIYATGNPAISALGDTIQSSDSFGGVKAMVRFQGDGTYVLCYNGATGARTGSGCGYTVTSAGGSLYNINFGAGIDVQQRFFSLSGSSTIVVFGFPGSNTLQVNVGNTSPNFAYYIIVY